MDTQNTPIHIKLWHHDFWRLCFANLLLMMSVYMLLPALPHYMMHEGYDALHIASAMGAYGLGIFLLGPFCSYWVQRYRRNHVCQLAMAGVVASILVIYYLEVFTQVAIEYWMIICARLVLGACLGLAQMALGSTLIIDTCESFQRTEANYITSWFSRFALALGPIVSILVIDFWGVQMAFPVAAITAIASLVLVSLVKFPFKAPADHMCKLSLDRFFLPQGFPLFINIVLSTMVVGMFLAHPHSFEFFVMVFVGLVLAVLAEKYAFADADLKSEVITGLVLISAALLISLSHQRMAVEFIVPAMMGMGIGIIGSRFLLFYIKLAKHCQRGTSMSSFFLAWEFGLSLGLYLGFLLMDESYIRSIIHQFEFLDLVDITLVNAGLGLAIFSLLIYNFAVHPWYMKHRNR